MQNKIAYALFTGVYLLFFSSAISQSTNSIPLLKQQREKAYQLYSDGNYQEALSIYKSLALNNKNDAKQVGHDLNMSISCLKSINKLSETDKLREQVVELHENNWRLLYTAAESYFNATHYGYIVAGEFHRGSHRGGGRYVNSYERDRIRSLQLMEQAMQKASDESEKNELAYFHLTFARMLMGYRGTGESWRLQYLSDLSELLDFEEGYSYYHGGQTRGAAVKEDGSPVYYTIPESYETTKNDGEKWRWMLHRASELYPELTNQVKIAYANFLYQQFGVQTMSSYGNYFREKSDSREKSESGTFALHTLKENETIARLASGINRFTLPGDANFIRIYQEIVKNNTSGYREQALNALARIFENRRQYEKATYYWKESIEKHGAGSNKYKQKNLDQIVKNWGHFEPVTTHPEKKKATVYYKFRNGKRVTFNAREIHVKKLLDDVKSYLKSNPRKLDWDKMSIGNIGYMLVQGNEKKYVGKTVANWKLSLTPRKMHFDKRITIKTPLKKAGAYLLTAEMEEGNTSRILVWIDNMVIVKKQLDNATFFFIADAVTGKPMSDIHTDFFGYRQEATKWEKVIGRRYNVITKHFTQNTDKKGRIIVKPDDLERRYQWLVTAGENKDRLAYLGFSGIWYGRYYDHEYNETKTYVITDRPVYRPAQPVKFKFWVRQAKYDQKNTSVFAGRSFSVRIDDPKGEKIFEKNFKADDFGGFDSEYLLPKDATLGIYSIYIPGYRRGTFRVEEYKKPEFEVSIEAPKEPVMLGEKISAKIKARYYFGAPVTQAKVKYKILRSEYNENWYPPGIWDWFYGPGYWWFAYNYDWYPGWREWGCKRPYFWWWPQTKTPPELVTEVDAQINDDGTIKVDIDTSFAKEMHGGIDHKYEIVAEVRDESRRTIVGKGTVLVARKPFKVYAWVDRGHYSTGDVVQAQFSARTIDGKPVIGKGILDLCRITHKNNKSTETSIQKWELNTDDEGRAKIQIKAAKGGQYRLSYRVTDSKNHTIEGGYLFTVIGKGSKEKSFRFSDIELVPDKREYAPNENVRLNINTDQSNSTVILFVRPSNGIYLTPEILRIKGKTTLKQIAITHKDMPNFFVEAFTVSQGKIFSDVREIVVPPEKRVLNVQVQPSSQTYKPGEKASVQVKLTDYQGEPFIGSTVLSIYDKSVEYISGGSNVPEIKSFFWKWRRRHNPRTESSANRYFANLLYPKEIAMKGIGVFGHLIADEFADDVSTSNEYRSKREGKIGMAKKQKADFAALPSAAPMDALKEAVVSEAVEMEMAEETDADISSDDAPGKTAEPAVRKHFADTAFWVGSLVTDQNGIAKISFDMPENLTGWKISAWGMGHGTIVGQGSSEVVTKKNLMLRLQSPRFFVEKDEVVLSANIHNYLDKDKKVRAVLELPNGALKTITPSSKTIHIPAGGEKCVDFRVTAVKEGETTIRMKALSDEESDAMEMNFPVFVHGMLKTESFCGVIRPEQNTSDFTIQVPSQRRIDQSMFEIRYSPTLAGAMVDALPYLTDYPYGCTEQTLSRFLPTVITQRILKDLGLDLKSIQEKRTNLNAQEIGNDKERSTKWKRWDRNPVYDENIVADMIKQGVKRLSAMQLSDGGWGWFSGWQEHSYPHTTAYVVNGLIVARGNGVSVPQNIMDRGIKWLKNYQMEEVKKIKNALKKKNPYKTHADNLDAFVYMVLVESNNVNKDMDEFLYRDRNQISLYGKAMYGMALHKQEQKQKLQMILRNIEQYLIQDKENQTAYLNLPNNGYWWYWYGSEFEAHAYYLKLLSLTAPKSEKAAGLVKYLLNNRKNATYWNSTRDTAICIEALADYLRASGEGKPDMVVEIFIDGQKHKEEKVTQENLFAFDNKLILSGKAVTSGKHKIQVKREGKGPLYFNAYLTHFTLEDFITKAGLEIKVERKYYKLKKVDKTIKVAGSRGQALDQKVEKYKRLPLKNFSTVKSGDLVEIELIIKSKNDYEYIVFEDMKAAGFEPVQLQSGHTGNDLGAYMELRDERVVFFVRWLARGKHSVSYRMRAEIPGKFSALPTKAFAMYAPELKANSDEIKIKIVD